MNTPTTKKLLENICQSDKDHHLFDKNDSLVVGVSGGPDSIALLMLLTLLQFDKNFSIHVAHLNHGLLHKEAQGYFKTAEEISRKFGLSFHYKKINLKRIAQKKKQSIEDAGRDERYAFFEKVATKTRSTKIVTAHTLDDQAETVLHRIIRGAGAKGLVGIPFKRKHGKFTLIRPLLSSEKKDLLSFLRERKVSFCVDPTNKDIHFLRNRIRHKLIPMLSASFNPRIKHALSNLQAAFSEIQNYFDAEGPRFYKKCLKKRSPRCISLSIRKIRKLHPAFQRDIFFRCLEDLRGDLKKINATHIVAILRFVQSQERFLETHLPDGLRVTKSQETLTFIS